MQLVAARHQFLFRFVARSASINTPSESVVASASLSSTSQNDPFTIPSVCKFHWTRGAHKIFGRFEVRFDWKWITCWNRTGVVAAVGEEEGFRHVLSILSPTSIYSLKTPTVEWNRHLITSRLTELRGNRMTMTRETLYHVEMFRMNAKILRFLASKNYQPPPRAHMEPSSSASPSLPTPRPLTPTPPPPLLPLPPPLLLLLLSHWGH